jgi:hypothetical protein
LARTIQAEGIIAIRSGHTGDLTIGILAGRDRAYNRAATHPVFGGQPVPSREIKKPGRS